MSGYLTDDASAYIKEVCRVENQIMEQIKENMEKIDVILRTNQYNRSMAYYIFYQSYFNYKLGNIDNAQYALHKFHNTNVSIKNFTIAIQNLYRQVTEGLQMVRNYVVD